MPEVQHDYLINTFADLFFGLMQSLQFWVWGSESEIHRAKCKLWYKLASKSSFINKEYKRLNLRQEVLEQVYIYMSELLWLHYIVSSWGIPKEEQYPHGTFLCPLCVKCR